MILLSDFASMCDVSPGKITTDSRHISMNSDSLPAFPHRHPAWLKTRKHEGQEIECMLNAGVIEPLMSEYASSVRIAPKKNVKMRFGADYRMLYAVTVRDTYPLARMDKCIDSLPDAALLFKTDCNSEYWQTEIPKADGDKTTFSSHHGLFRSTGVPVELKNEPALLQRAVDTLLSRVRWWFSLAHLDDIIAYPTSVTEHLVHVRIVLLLGSMVYCAVCTALFSFVHAHARACRAPVPRVCSHEEHAQEVLYFLSYLFYLCITRAAPAPSHVA